MSISWTGQEELVLPQRLGALKFDSKSSFEDKGVRFNPVDGEVSVSLGSYSKRFTPPDSPHSKPLKQWFKLWKIPPWKRDCVVQLVQNDKIVALLMDGEWVVASGVVGTPGQALSDTVAVSHLP
jgi:tRNA(Ile)-lysidine synthase